MSRHLCATPPSWRNRAQRLDCPRRPTMNPAQRKIARVLFDETHSESWSISAERAREMSPENPVNSSYQRAADALAERDFVVARPLDGPLDRAALAGAG